MTLIPIKAIDARHLSNGRLASALPEFYKLKNVIENQAWHAEQTVFDHSIKSLQAYEAIVAFDYLSPNEKLVLDQYLDKKVGDHSRKALLQVAVALHDIGKLVSLQHGADGQTSCPSHGVIGRWVGLATIKKIDMEPQEQDYVLNLISDHLLPSDLIELAINNQWTKNEVAKILLQHRKEMAVELIILAYADWLGCDVRPAVEKERIARIELAHITLSILAKNTP